MDLQVQDARRRTGWFWLDNEVFEVGLDPYSFMVYAYLVRIADRASEVALCSLRKTAKVLGISKEKVRQALRELERKGLIVRKHRKGEKGNYYSNLYVLTSKDEWVCHDMAHGVPRDGTGVGYEMAHPVPRNGTPPSTEEPKPPESQGGDKPKERPIKNNKSQKSIKNKNDKHTHIGGGVCVKEGEVSKEDYEKTYEELREKWKEVLGELSLRRIKPSQAVFFLENSSLGLENTVRFLRAVDQNSAIKNPVGLLLSVLPLGEQRFKWLLAWEPGRRTEDEGWKRLYESKRKEWEKLGVELPPAESEEEANALLTKAFETYTRAIYEKLPEDKREKLLKKVDGNEYLALCLIGERKGVMHLSSLYVE